MNVILIAPLIFGCLVAVIIIILRGYVAWSFLNDPHTKFDDADEFEAWYEEECRIAAAELVGTHNSEYVAVLDRMLGDDARKAAARKFYNGMV